MKAKWERRIVLSVLAVILICFGNTGNSHAADPALDTDRYDVNIKVNSDNSMQITETITVDFKEGRHGIYRYIPIKGTARFTENDDWVELDYNMKVDNIEIPGYEYETSEEEGRLSIQIGSADKIIDGKHTYNISYRCRFYDDRIDAFDVFYYNVLPHNWTTPIDKTKITISMPKAFDKKKLDVYAGTLGDNENADLIKTKVSGNTIEIRSTEQLPDGAGITVQEMLPDGYFENAMNTEWAYPAMLLIGILCVALTGLLWVLFGRDRRMVIPVEFYPPDGITSSEMGYVIDGKVNKQDIISMIISFADKGYIKIEEKDREFTLHKTNELPMDAKPYEHTMMNGLFESDNKTVKLSDLPENFYESYQAAEYQIKAEYNSSSKKLFHTSGNVARIFGAILMVLPVGLSILLGGIYARSQYGIYIAAIASAILFLMYFCGLIHYDRKGGMKKGLYIAGHVLFSVVSLIILGISAYVIYSYVGVIAAIIAVACSFMAYLFTRQMRRLTEFGNALVGRIMGFKHFIEVAELKKLNLLAEENPSYFYNLLPYVYVFGLSDKWAGNFASIEVNPPTWYDGPYSNQMFNTWIFMNAFSHCLTSLDSEVNSNVAAATSDDAGSFGSFGGGGGFSGGGFGGGGGGAW